MADRRVTQLTSLGTAAPDDLLYIIDDPSGAPQSKSIPVQGLLRGPELLVAANDALDTTKCHADYQCDGTADDVQIQAAIDSLPGSGGHVRLSEGTFVLAAAVTLVDNLLLSGQGVATNVELAAASGASWMLRAVSKTRIVVRDMLLDGVQATNASVGLSFAGCTYCRIEGITVTDAQNSGIAFIDSCSDCLADRCLVVDSGTNEACFSIKESACVQFTNCTAMNSGRNGFEIENGCTIIDVIGCTSYGAAATGFDVHTHSAYGENYRIRFMACRAISNTTHGFYPSGSVTLPQYDNLVSFIGCTSYNNGGRQFLLIRQKHARIQDCIAIGGAGASSVIELDSSCEDGLVISGNHVERGAGATYGIQNTAATNTVIDANDIYDCSTHAGIYSNTPAQITNNKVSGGINGIYLASGADRSSVVGNSCFNNTTNGIYLNGVSYCTLQGNRCFDDQGIKTQDNGICEAGAADWNLIVGNLSRAADHSVAGIVVIGGNTVSQHNLG